MLPLSSRINSKIERWPEHFNILLNQSIPTDPSILEEHPSFPSVPHLNGISQFNLVCKAIKGLKNNKSAVSDSIPAEIYKYGGYLFLRVAPTHLCHLDNADCLFTWLSLICRRHGKLLWDLLSQFGVLSKFLSILRQCHGGMQAQVQISGQQSAPFTIKIGIKQGCVLAPIIFNSFLTAVTTTNTNGVNIQFSLAGKLFNIWCLQASTKTPALQICELQYADDCTLIAHSPESLQCALSVVTATYRAVGL